ncbi:hypothetical protein [Kitasatospora sp. NPDC058190]|uniref:hypothetical protein n=1 Tax=Kitasatospora sp. NPDC058190 TaxID=3346371 RepID=UPI0036DC4136
MTPRPAGTATSPHDAAFLPRLRRSPRPAERPITEPVAKLGGEPCRPAEPAWPLCPTTGEPLVFIDQFSVPGNESASNESADNEPGSEESPSGKSPGERSPGAEARLAYLFLAADNGLMGGRDPKSGDGLLPVQPGVRIPPFAVIGPTRHPGSYAVAGRLPAVPARRRPRSPLPGRRPRPRPPRRTPLLPDRRGLGRRTLAVPFALSDARDEGDPSFLDFGYGDGFSFLGPDGSEGRVFWGIA